MITGAGGIDIKTTMTAENLICVSRCTKYSGEVTHAAVAAKTSVRLLVPWVNAIKPTAKTKEKAARQMSKFLRPCNCDRTEMAMTGMRHATTVEIPDVNLSALSSDHDSNVFSVFTSFAQGATGVMTPLVLLSALCSTSCVFFFDLNFLFRALLNGTYSDAYQCVRPSTSPRGFVSAKSGSCLLLAGLRIHSRPRMSPANCDHNPFSSSSGLSRSKPQVFFTAPL